jgi:hypothetical protein
LLDIAQIDDHLLDDRVEQGHSISHIAARGPALVVEDSEKVFGEKSAIEPRIFDRCWLSGEEAVM